MLYERCGLVMNDLNVYIDDIILSNKDKSILLNFFRNNDVIEIIIDDENTEKNLKKFKLIKVNIDADNMSYHLTEKGRLYCEKEIEKEKKEKKEYLMKWISLMLSIMAIFISISSLIVQTASYYNSTKETTNETTEIIKADIDAIINIDVGIL